MNTLHITILSLSKPCSQDSQGETFTCNISTENSNRYNHVNQQSDDTYLEYENNRNNIMFSKNKYVIFECMWFIIKTEFLRYFE
jgi:hypothetical protein